MALETHIEDAELVPTPPGEPTLEQLGVKLEDNGPELDREILPAGPPTAAGEADPSPAPPAPRPAPTKRAMAQAADSRRRRRKNALKKAVDQLKDEEEIEALLEQLQGEKRKPKPPAELAAPPPPPPAAAEVPPSAAGPTDKQKAAAKAVGLFVHALAQGLEMACEAKPELKSLSLKGNVPTIELNEQGFGIGQKDKQLALIEAWSPLYAEYMDIDVPKWLELGLPALFTTVMVFGPGAYAMIKLAKSEQAKEAKAA